MIEILLIVFLLAWFFGWGGIPLPAWGRIVIGVILIVLILVGLLRGVHL